MMDLVLHAVFFTNLAGLTIMAAYWAGWRYFADEAALRQTFWRTCLWVFAANVAFVVFVAVYMPGLILPPDGRRYLFEIQQIAAAPWEWNPFTGAGPGYEVTAKMGMSYLYGVILFFHQIDSLAAVLGINVFFSFLTSIAAFLLVRTVTEDPRPAFLAMLLVAVFPETMFWTARVTRETLTLFLLPIFVYTCIRIYETLKVRYLCIAALLLVLILLTRAQIALFAILIVVYFGFLAVRGERRTQGLLVVAIGGLLLYAVYPIIEMQLVRALGRSFLVYLSWDVEFWLSRWEPFTRTITRVLTPVARGSYGPAGVVLAPAVLAIFALTIFTVLRFRRIFGARAFAAGLLLFLTAVFIVMLGLSGAVNIRFRSTIAPLLLPLLTVTLHRLWASARLPRFRWYMPREDQLQKAATARTAGPVG